jgi:hypothetical protein
VGLRARRRAGRVPARRRAAAAAAVRPGRRHATTSGAEGANSCVPAL